MKRISFNWLKFDVDWKNFGSKNMPRVCVTLFLNSMLVIYFLLLLLDNLHFMIMTDVHRVQKLPKICVLEKKNLTSNSNSTCQKTLVYRVSVKSNNIQYLDGTHTGDNTL